MNYEHNETKHLEQKFVSLQHKCLNTYSNDSNIWITNKNEVEDRLGLSLAGLNKKRK